VIIAANSKDERTGRGTSVVRVMKTQIKSRAIIREAYGNVHFDVIWENGKPFAFRYGLKVAIIEIV
jgi:hypothetical protein